MLDCVSMSFTKIFLRLIIWNYNFKSHLPTSPLLLLLFSHLPLMMSSLSHSSIVVSRLIMLEHATMIWNLTFISSLPIKSGINKTSPHSSFSIVVSSLLSAALLRPKGRSQKERDLTWIHELKRKRFSLVQFNYGHIHMVTVIQREKRRKKLTVKFLTLNETER